MNGTVLVLLFFILCSLDNQNLRRLVFPPTQRGQVFLTLLRLHLVATFLVPAVTLWPVFAAAPGTGWRRGTGKFHGSVSCGLKPSVGRVHCRLGPPSALHLGQKLLCTA